MEFSFDFLKNFPGAICIMGFLFFGTAIICAIDEFLMRFKWYRRMVRLIETFPKTLKDEIRHDMKMKIWDWYRYKKYKEKASRISKFKSTNN